MLIDEWMPQWDAVERHETRIQASRAAVWQAVRTADFTRSPVIGALLALRSLPGLLAGHRRPRAPGSTLDGLLRNGFVLLAEHSQEELLLGVAGRFWRPSGDVARLTAAELRDFDRPDSAVATWNFTLADDGDAVRLATETRVRCTDADSRPSFGRYWFVVGPFSALIRREMLRAIRRAAESGAAPTR